MKVQTLGKRSAAVLAALALAVGGNVVAAEAASVTYIDCQLFGAGEPDHIDPALTSTLDLARSKRTERFFCVVENLCSKSTANIW